MDSFSRSRGVSVFWYGGLLLTYDQKPEQKEREKAGEVRGRRRSGQQGSSFQSVEDGTEEERNTEKEGS
ncbi:hypothetical protein H8959_013298 [Pygathrix nigripes]